MLGFDDLGGRDETPIGMVPSQELAELSRPETLDLVISIFT